MEMEINDAAADERHRVFFSLFLLFSAQSACTLRARHCARSCRKLRKQELLICEVCCFLFPFFYEKKMGKKLLAILFWHCALIIAV